MDKKTELKDVIETALDYYYGEGYGTDHALELIASQFNMTVNEVADLLQ